MVSSSYQSHTISKQILMLERSTIAYLGFTKNIVLLAENAPPKLISFCAALTAITHGLASNTACRGVWVGVGVRNIGGINIL
jgi:hypothetical protein